MPYWVNTIERRASRQIGPLNMRSFYLQIAVCERCGGLGADTHSGHDCIFVADVASSPESVVVLRTNSSLRHVCCELRDLVPGRPVGNHVWGVRIAQSAKASRGDRR